MYIFFFSLVAVVVARSVYVFFICSLFLMLRSGARALSVISHHIFRWIWRFLRAWDIKRIHQTRKHRLRIFYTHQTHSLTHSAAVFFSFAHKCISQCHGKLIRRLNLRLKQRIEHANAESKNETKASHRTDTEKHRTKFCVTLAKNTNALWIYMRFR